VHAPLAENHHRRVKLAVVAQKSKCLVRNAKRPVTRALENSQDSASSSGMHPLPGSAIKANI
jgi:hypothetical protein